MKIVICGGRTYHLTPTDYVWLQSLRAAIPITAVALGRGRGVDADVEYWARCEKLPVDLFPAEWERYGPAAGPRRTAAMAAVAEGCVAFPGGRGTADMVRRARQHGLPVWERLGAPAARGA